MISTARRATSLLAVGSLLLGVGCSSQSSKSDNPTTSASATTRATAAASASSAPSSSASTASASASSPASATASTSATASASTSASPEAQAVVGSWTNSLCGKRTYERILTFTKEGKFDARDLVSPCPKDRKCVWSGIVDRKGTWALEGETLALKLTDGTERGPGETFPLEFAFRKGALVEPPSCEYTKRAAP
ncbi:MAG: hypothetical protein U0271_29980 [Polyangiaceae bacterium]